MFGCKCKYLYQRSKWTMLKIGNVSNRFFSTRPSLIIEFFSPQGASTTCKGAQRYKKQEFWKISCTEISTWAETLPTCPILSRWSSAWIFLLLNEKFGVNIPCLLILFWARLPILLRLVHRPHKLPEQPGLAIWLSKLEFSFFDISVSEVSSRSNAGFVTCCRASHGQ